MSNSEHWLVRGLEGVNVLTLIILLLAGAKFYFDLDKDMALMKRDMAEIQRTLSSIQDYLRRSDMPLYSLPPPATRSIEPGESL